MAVPAGWNEGEWQTTTAGTNPDMWKFAASAPGYVDVLRAAAANPALFSQPGTLEGWLHMTPYWQSTSAAKRNWDWIGATDPAEQAKQFSLIKENVYNTGQKLGFDAASNADMDEAAWLAAQEDWSAEKVQSYLAGKWYMRFKAGTQTTDVRFMPGDIGNLMTGQFKLGFDYGVPINPNMAADNAFKIAMGWADEEGMTQGMRNWAKGYYAGNDTIISAIDAGYTVRDWASPYIQLASQELELNPNEVDFSKPMWGDLIQYSDPNGTRRPLSLNEATVRIRNDAQYGFDHTANGQQKSAQLTTSLAQMMGSLGG